MSIQISIVDDHPLIINGIRNMFRQHSIIHILSHYNSGAALLEGLKLVQPDILLLDIHLPDISGESLARTVTKEYPDIKIIALTNLDNVYYIQSMFRAGVKGYVLKTAPEETIIDAILTVRVDKQFLEARLQEEVLQASLSEGRQSGNKLLLTRREKEVLQMIADNLTSKEIAEKLFLSKRTVDHHRNNLLVKLSVKNTVALLAKAWKLDLIAQ